MSTLFSLLTVKICNSLLNDTFTADSVNNSLLNDTFTADSVNSLKKIKEIVKETHFD